MSPSSLIQDLRYALRTLRKSPGFAAAAIGTLALSIGVNTAIFSVVRGVLLKPLPFTRPEGLVRVEERGEDGLASNTGYATFLDWRERSRSFSAIAVTARWRPTLASAPGFPAERVEGLRVSDGFFRMIGVTPALGRDFLASEDRPAGERTVLLSDGLWRTRFGSDPAIAGKLIRLGETPYRVAGVLPADFESLFSPEADKPASIFAPLRYDASLPAACRTCRHLRAVARLASGVSASQAEAEMSALSAQLSREHPGEYAATGAFVRTLPDTLTRPVRPALWSLLVAVGLVLLIGCANVASLMLARASRRSGEVAVRTALGAPRARIAALFLVEALALALAGGAISLLVASWTLQLLLALAPASLPRLSEIRLDGGVLLYTLLVSLATGLVFGLGPALSMSRRHAEPALRESSSRSAGRSPRRFGGALVVIDVALALVLLSGALLLTESASRLLGVRPGFRADGLLTMEVDVSGARYGDEAALAAFWDQVLERTAALPGVTGVGLVSQLPLGGNVDGVGIHAQDRPSANPETDPAPIGIPSATAISAPWAFPCFAGAASRPPTGAAPRPWCSSTTSSRGGCGPARTRSASTSRSAARTARGARSSAWSAACGTPRWTLRRRRRSTCPALSSWTTPWSSCSGRRAPSAWRPPRARPSRRSTRTSPSRTRRPCRRS